MSKVVLAYSGGLDTSVILKWLMEQGHEVIAYIADVGQREDFEAAEEKALKIGASKVFIEDLQREFVEDYIYPAIRGSARYENRYLLGTSLARPVIAKRQIEIAKEEGAESVSHGATGKGNDQVRFELAYYTLFPEVKVIAPWKDKDFLDKFKGRTDLLNYAAEHGIDVEATKSKPFSMDENLLHISYEAGILEDPAAKPPVDMFRLTKDVSETPDEAVSLKITFDRGTPVKVENLNEGRSFTDPLMSFQYLNELAGEHGVGRVDIVENRFVGLKSRGVYETPAGTVLYAAHQDLETLSIDREVYRTKEMLINRYSELIYNGFWFSPECRYIQKCMDIAQESVTGEVQLRLFKGNVIVDGRSSSADLYDSELSSMDLEGGYDQEDADGFIKINAVRLR